MGLLTSTVFPSPAEQSRSRDSVGRYDALILRLVVARAIVTRPGRPAEADGSPVPLEAAAAAAGGGPAPQSRDRGLVAGASAAKRR